MSEREREGGRERERSDAGCQVGNNTDPGFLNPGAISFTTAAVQAPCPWTFIPFCLLTDETLLVAGAQGRQGYCTSASI